VDTQAVEAVYMLDVPGSVDELVQNVGRCGRAGPGAVTVFATERQISREGKLHRFLSGEVCRWQALMDFYDHEGPPPPRRPAGTCCDVCDKDEEVNHPVLHLIANHSLHTAALPANADFLPEEETARLVNAMPPNPYLRLYPGLAKHLA